MPVPKEPIDFTRVQQLQKSMFEDMTLMFTALNKIATMPLDKGVDMQIEAQQVLNQLDQSFKGEVQNA